MKKTFFLLLLLTACATGLPAARPAGLCPATACTSLPADEEPDSLKDNVDSTLINDPALPRVADTFCNYGYNAGETPYNIARRRAWKARCEKAMMTYWNLPTTDKKALYGEGKSAVDIYATVCTLLMKLADKIGESGTTVDLLDSYGISNAVRHCRKWATQDLLLRNASKHATRKAARERELREWLTVERLLNAFAAQGVPYLQYWGGTLSGVLEGVYEGRLLDSRIAFNRQLQKIDRDTTCPVTSVSLQAACQRLKRSLDKACTTVTRLDIEEYCDDAEYAKLLNRTKQNKEALKKRLDSYCAAVQAMAAAEGNTARAAACKAAAAKLLAELADFIATLPDEEE